MLYALTDIYAVVYIAPMATTFAVLAEPTRRRILDLLRERERSVGELVAALGISQPAVSHHLKLMREAELVRFAPSGASNVYYIDPAGLASMRAWLDQHWTRALKAFEDSFVEKKPDDDTD